MIGKKLGNYEVTARIGAGGMGEVYRARDTRLGRDVAIKVLPPAFAADPERLGRFEREARLLAGLNHPHIATLYGFEHADGVHFLAMELIDGEDLAERLRAGALPVREALRIGRDVADALGAAHENGIVHRDLKPANIVISNDGNTKVLDFGLAKALEGEPGDPNLSQSPTITAMAGTAHGVILGTAAYMSPEQARGKTLDRRTDLWSFGCVLFEALTGRVAFPGETVSDTIAKILEREPDWSQLPTDTPPGVQRLLRRCLEKDLKRRLGDVGEARVELGDSLSGTSLVGSSSASTFGAAGRATPARTRLWQTATVLATLTAVALAVMLARRTVVPAPVVRLSIEAPPDARLAPFGDFAGPAVVSPDGRRIAFVAFNGVFVRTLYVRELDGLDASPLAGTEGATFPFWSPDGRSLGYFTDTELKRIDLDGGFPITLCRAENGRGGSWSSVGSIVFSPDFQAPLLAVSASGGAPVAITHIDSTRHTTHRWPQVLPDGKHVIYLAATHNVTTEQAPSAQFASIDGTETRELVETGTAPVYGSGHLFYSRNRTLLVRPFDPETGTFKGEPVALSDQVLVDNTTWRLALSTSENGILAYHKGSSADIGTGAQLEVFAADGQLRQTIDSFYAAYQLSLSPDGTRVVAGYRTQGSSAGKLDIWVYDLVRNVKNRLTFDIKPDVSPVWSPDGSVVAYASITPLEKKGELRLVDANGGNDRLLVQSDSTQLAPSSWTPDGRYILCSGGVYATSESNVCAVRVRDGEIIPLIMSPFDETNAEVSPDGKWIAYTSMRTGNWEVYAQRFADPARVEKGLSPGTWQVSTSGGGTPVWSASGRELYYIKADGTVWKTTVEQTGESLQIGEPQTIFTCAPYNLGNLAFDVSADGKTFVVNSFSSRVNSSITMVINWPSLLAH